LTGGWHEGDKNKSKIFASPPVVVQFENSWQGEKAVRID